MSGGMDCTAARALLPLRLDGELDAAERNALEAHLAACAACQAEADMMADESRRLRALAGAYRAPQSLAARLRSALDAAEAEASARSQPHAPRPRRMAALATAAALLLLIVGAAGGYFAAHEPAESRLAAEITGAHMRALVGDRLIDVASSDRHTVKPWFNGRTDLSPPVEDLTEQGFRLVGGRVDFVGERRVAVLVYRHRQHTIDLFMWPAGGAPAPPAADARRGYNLRGWTAGGTAFAAVSDANASDLDRFVALARTRLVPSDSR